MLNNVTCSPVLRRALLPVLLCAFLALVTPADAADRQDARITRHNDAHEQRLTNRFWHLLQRLERICDKAREHRYEHVIALCNTVGNNQNPEPEPNTPTLALTADPTVVATGNKSTLVWNSEHTDSCEASGNWSGLKVSTGSETVTVLEDATYTLSCYGNDETVTKSVQVSVTTEPEPEPDINHIVISEVLYDLAADGSQGSEASGRNEWVEIYNPTNNSVDLTNWEIGNGSSNDVITTESLSLASGERLIITNATTTANFWNFTDTAVVYLGSSISGGLSNSGDVVMLFDDTATIIDAVSYGNNTDAFDPSVTSVSAGESIARTNPVKDTDLADDWSASTPTPGT